MKTEELTHDCILHVTAVDSQMHASIAIVDKLVPVFQQGLEMQLKHAERMEQLKQQHMERMVQLKQQHMEIMAVFLVLGIFLVFACTYAW